MAKAVLLNRVHRAMHSPDLLMPLAVFVFCTAYMLWGEKWPYGENTVFDSEHYVKLACKFGEDPLHVPMNGYQAQRFLPGLIVGVAVFASGVRPTPDAIIFGFEVFAIVICTVTAFLWGMIANTLKIGTQGKWLGCIALFINAGMKFNLFFPGLTDMAALALSAFMLLCFLRGWDIRLLCAIIIGSVIWPTSHYVGFMLFIWPLKKANPSRPRIAYTWVVTTGVVLAFLIAAIRVRYFRPYEHGGEEILSLLPLSVAGLMAYLFYFVFFAAHAGELFERRSYINLTVFIRVSIVLLLIIAVNAFRAIISLFPSHITMPGFIKFMILMGTKKPFLSYLAHVVYFGPMMLVIIFLWPKICREAHRYGIGMTLVLFAAVILGIGSESRHIINFVPFLFAFAVYQIEKLRWKAPQIFGFIAVTALFSKFWLPLNWQPNLVTEADLLKFPGHRLFMNVGYLMNNTMYLFQGTCVILTAVLFYFLLFRSGPDVRGKVHG